MVGGVLIVGTADNILRPLLVGRETRMPDYMILLSTLGGLVRLWCSRLRRRSCAGRTVPVGLGHVRAGAASGRAGTRTEPTPPPEEP